MDAAWWRWVTESETDLLLAVDSSDCLLGASRAFRRLVDVAVTNGATFTELFHPDDRVNIGSLLHRPQRARIRYSDGRWVAVELRAAAIEPNLVIEVIEAEGAAVRPRDLSWENALLYAVVEHAQVGIIACDERGRVVTYNPTIRQYHREPNRGLPLEEFVKGFSFFELDGVTPMDAQQSPLARAYRGERGRSMSTRCSLETARCATGSPTVAGFWTGRAGCSGQWLRCRISPTSGPPRRSSAGRRRRMR